MLDAEERPCHHDRIHYEGKSTGDGSLRALIQAAQSGDRSAREELLCRHMGALRTFVRLRSDERLRMRESESDLLQSVCREALEDLADFEYRGDPSFRAWLFTLALNKVREKGRFHSAERRNAGREAASLDAPPRFADGAQGIGAVFGKLFSPSEHAIAEETEQRLEAAFDRLSEEHREVILLARILGLPHAEIAVRLSKSEVAVRSLLSRALVALSGELPKD